MSRAEWIGAAVAFLVALALLVVAVLVKAWNTEPEDVVRKAEDKRRYLPTEQSADITDWVPRHEPAVRRFHQAGGYE